MSSNILNKLALYTSIIAYLLGLFMGFFFDLPIVGNKNKLIGSKIDFYFELDKFSVFIEIMKNNLSVIFLIISLGIFSLGILSYFYVYYNGLILGYIFLVVSNEIGINETLIYTYPHLFEVIPIIWSSYIGTMISYKLIYNVVLGREASVSWLNIIIQILICCTLVILAAFAESYISMK